jgi:hydroxypyruvate reductase
VKVNRAELTDIFLAAVAAVDPAMLVEQALRRRRLDPGPHPVTILALGKAAAGMVEGAARVFGKQLRGVAAVPTAAELPQGVAAVVGGHPIPNRGSLAAGEALLTAAKTAPEEGLVLCLLSGGGSALAEVLPAGVDIVDLELLTRRLLESGAAIAEVNAVRRSLSLIKNGRLAARVVSPRLITLAVSDVGSAPPATIASGPTLAADDTHSAAAILGRYGLLDGLPAGVISAIRSAEPGRHSHHDFEVIADGSIAAAGALAEASRRGYAAQLADRELAGEAAVEARRVVAHAPRHDGAIVIHRGETTVTVTGSGRGGRNHEAALVAAIELAGRPGIFLAGGTDGIDGMTSGAGAVVDGATATAAVAAGLDPAAFLANHDSGGFFDAVAGRIVTGPTGTNVADIWIVGSGS